MRIVSYGGMYWYTFAIVSNSRNISKYVFFGSQPHYREAQAAFDVERPHPPGRIFQQLLEIIGRSLLLSKYLNYADTYLLPDMNHHVIQYLSVFYDHGKARKIVQHLL